MAYVKKIIGKDEHIIGIARLHWIYLAKGMFGFLVFLIMGLVVDAVLIKVLTSISELVPSTGGKILLVAGSWVTPLFVIFGSFYFLLYLLKVLYTEIALTEKRVIHKSGFIFVKIEEVNIEEISAENMDMGYFGSLLGYGYIMLDCRFVGDVKLPAIARANAFVKALHTARTNIVPIYPNATQVAQSLVSELPSHTSKDEKPVREMLKLQEPKPLVPQRDESGDVIQKEEILTPEIAVNQDHGHEKEILQLQIAKLELEVKLKEVEATDTKMGATENDIQKVLDSVTPIATPAPNKANSQTIAHPIIAPVNVAAAIQNGVPGITKMPQVTDKIAGELIASGLIPHPDEIKSEQPFVEVPAHPKAPTDEERLEPTKDDPLQHSFGSAAFVLKSTEGGSPKPEPAI